MNYGRYQTVKELGKGSMGVVYEAEDPQIERTVALKILRPDRMASEAFVHRFLKEAKAIGRLSHPNIVTVYDIGQDRETIYIAMEFLDGKPLSSIAEEKRLNAEEVIDLGIQAAETLDYAHQKGIVHRDVKPSNIIVNPTGQIKVTDFGIAHIEDPSASVQTQAGEILGTPAYMSPEQVLSRPVDGRSDLFSLGIILYELCTGRRPFGGDSLAAVFNAITQEDPVSPSKLNSSIPSELSGAIMKCLKKRPEERFENGKALAEALRKSIKKTEPAVSVPPKVRVRPRKNVYLIIPALILIMVAAAFLYHILRTGPPPPKLGVLRIESTPVGAQVFLDDALKGKSPVSLELPQGKHKVRLTLANYHDWEDQVQLGERETSLPVRLAPVEKKVKLGVLRIESTPAGAQIYVDGALKGNSPLKLELPQGKHEIRLTLANHHDWEAQVQLGEKETPVPVRLVPIAEK